MISSLLLCGSSYNKLKKISFIMYAVMLIRLLIGQANNVSNLFLIVNLALFAIIPLLINRIKNPYIKSIVSILSIIIWSIIIDIICYYMYPLFVGGASIYEYVFRGIVFNSKYVFSNTLLVVGIEIIEKLYNKILITNKEKNIEISVYE